MLVDDVMGDVLDDAHLFPLSSRRRTDDDGVPDIRDMGASASDDRATPSRDLDRQRRKLDRMIAALGTGLSRAESSFCRPLQSHRQGHRGSSIG